VKTTALAEANEINRSAPNCGRDISDVKAAFVKRRSDGPKIDKSALAFPEPRRIRDKEHLKFVSRHPCLICARTPSDPHHLRFAQPRALGRKVSDEFTVPLCRTHHREVHRIGNEPSWWERQAIDPMEHARVLWVTTHDCGADPVAADPTRSADTDHI
jgi:hypothetical protein